MLTALAGGSRSDVMMNEIENTSKYLKSLQVELDDGTHLGGISTTLESTQRLCCGWRAYIPIFFGCQVRGARGDGRYDKTVKWDWTRFEMWKIIQVS